MYRFSIPLRGWKDEDRPREKFLLKGAAALSDAELLAVLIGSGTRDRSAVTIGRQLLNKAENQLNSLARFSLEDLCNFKGIGQVKAVKIAAALELGRRRQQEPARQRTSIQSSKHVFELLHAVLGDLPHEEFWCIYLNNANRVMCYDQLSKGGITGTMVDIRLVYRQAIRISAVAIILAHNHPSGTLKPSESDIRLTRKLVEAGKHLDVQVLDHLIITEKAYFSFADEQLL
ncbi:RadC family protein [Aureitalea marina]|nr:DNA repair protein RadC [Aureitalea marina]